MGPIGEQWGHNDAQWQRVAVALDAAVAAALDASGSGATGGALRELVFAFNGNLRSEAPMVILVDDIQKHNWGAHLVHLACVGRRKKAPKMC